MHLRWFLSASYISVSTKSGGTLLVSKILWELVTIQVEDFCMGIVKARLQGIKNFFELKMGYVPYI